MLMVINSDVAECEELKVRGQVERGKMMKEVLKIIKATMEIEEERS